MSLTHDEGLNWHGNEIAVVLGGDRIVALLELLQHSSNLREYTTVFHCVQKENDDERENGECNCACVTTLKEHRESTALELRNERSSSSNNLTTDSKTAKQRFKIQHFLAFNDIVVRDATITVQGGCVNASQATFQVRQIVQLGHNGVCTQVEMMKGGLNRANQTTQTPCPSLRQHPDDR